ncbi:hypothetical protein Patl1_28066 [Pistacia atlantica]|uniref:Uncharacterized protein n=1 Tax=Pistacia atlantica TaxID=434234 RepID=A0ACC1BCU9_9ROSI|nr:hypothetical protein Patl1_28066 [Pistacia atlantica]
MTSSQFSSFPSSSSREVKQKNALGDGRGRRVLQDIGNLVTEQAPQGKTKTGKTETALSESVSAASPLCLSITQKTEQLAPCN